MEDEELKFGPNGGLVFCLEFLLENISWLEEALDSGEKSWFILLICSMLLFHNRESFCQLIGHR